VRVRVLLGVVAVIGAIGIAAGAYFFGRGSVDEDAISSSAYSRGFDAGRAQGNIEGFSDGQRAERRNLRATEQDYERRLNRESNRAFNAGWNAVFDGFGTWTPGAYYIVRSETGTDGAKYTLETRMEMRANQSYELCPEGGGICGPP
jgi:hypothetical protein